MEIFTAKILKMRWSQHTFQAEGITGTRAIMWGGPDVRSWKNTALQRAEGRAEWRPGKESGFGVKSSGKPHGSPLHVNTAGWIRVEEMRGRQSREDLSTEH